MSFYVYREGNKLKIHEGNQFSINKIVNHVGGANLGGLNYEHREEAEAFRDKWQAKIDIDPSCKPPYSIEKD